MRPFLRELSLALGLTTVALTPARGQEWYVFTTANSGLPDNNVLSLAIDRQGILWIGTKYEGLASFNGREWGHYKPPSGSRAGALPSAPESEPPWLALHPSASIAGEVQLAGPQAEAFYDLTIDSHDVKWIGTKIAGIKRFDGAHWTRYDTHNSPLPNDYAWSILADPEDRIWIGTKYGGLAVFDGTHWTTYNTGNSPLPSDDVTCLARDAAGRLWIGTTQGIAVFDGQQWTLYTPSNCGLPLGHVEVIDFDAAGVAWIGTWGAGLVRYDGNHWISFNTGNSGVRDDYIWSLAVDEAGVKWLGTFTKGLVVYDNQSWRVFNPNNSPLPHEMVYDIAIDRQGNKWLATLLGLAVYREGGVILSVGGSDSQIPRDLTLKPPAPNPFAEYTQIELVLTTPGRVNLTVHDVLGRRVKTLCSGTPLAPGHHQFLWNGEDARGWPVPAGVYLVVARTGRSVRTARVVRVR